MYKDDELYEINIDKLAYSLENNSNIKVSDYMIPIQSRYHLLSLEHDRIHNEINNEINKMINFDFNKYSTEDFKENFAKFWDWVKKMFDKFINWVQVFIKRIIAKIYELTIRFNKKESLYQKFNNKVFTSVDVQIKDKKLNPNIIEQMDKWIDRTNKWVETIEIDNKQMSCLLKGVSDTFKDMAEIIDNSDNTKSVNKYIDKIFYLDDKKQDTTIRNYFGCNVNETPKAIIILSEKYTKKLIENKKSLEKWLDKLKKFQKHFIDETKTEEFNDELANDIKKVFSHINYFNNMNYSFFINAVNVRRKVAKYILKACLGDLYDSLTNGEERNVQFNKFKNLPTVYKESINNKAIIGLPRKFHQKDVEMDKFRSMDNELEGAKGVTYRQGKGFRASRSGYDYFVLKDYNYIARAFKLTGSNNQISYSMGLTTDDPYGRYDTNILEKELKLFKDIENLTKKGDAKQAVTLFSNITGYNIDTNYNTFIFSFLDKLQDFNDSPTIILLDVCYTLYNYIFNESKDIFYHTTSTTKNITSLNSYSSGQNNKNIFYTENRIYGGLNQIIQRNAINITANNGKSSPSFQDIINKMRHAAKGGYNISHQLTDYVISNFRVYKVSIPDKTVIYGDPEMVHENDTKIRSVFIPTSQPLPSEDITDLIKNVPTLD